MGHAKVDTTLNVYTQLLDGAPRGAAEKVGSELITIDHKSKGRASSRRKTRDFLPRNGREGGISPKHADPSRRGMQRRTRDLSVPNRARYQASLLPEVLTAEALQRLRFTLTV